MAKTSRYKRSLASNWILLVILALAVGGLGFLAWQQLRPQGLPQGIAGSNGRIEATEIDIAAKLAGRISEILVREGQFVRRGEDLVKMDTSVLEAQLREAKAQLEQAQVTVETARSQVSQRESERPPRRRWSPSEAELAAARQRFSRAEQLVKQGWATQQRLDDDRAAFESAQAAVTAAKAQVASAEATLNTAKSQVLQAELKSRPHAPRSSVFRQTLTIACSRPARRPHQFLVAQPGEVVQAGGRVLNMIDLTDVYMTFFLPTEQAGRVAIGAEARIVLDAAPQYVIPARISFVSDVAQFTPKEVETAEERQKLMFRLRATIDKELLERYLTYVKTGLPGMAYVKIDPRAEWPPHLQVRLPELPQ